MSRFKMEIYTPPHGVCMTISWKNGEEYRLGQAFLKNLAGPCGESTFVPILNSII
jgi:hypothetical protein